LLDAGATIQLSRTGFLRALELALVTLRMSEDAISDLELGNDVLIFTLHKQCLH
jgi:hypothetical protein